MHLHEATDASYQAFETHHPLVRLYAKLYDRKINLSANAFFKLKSRPMKKALFSEAFLFIQNYGRSTITPPFPSPPLFEGGWFLPTQGAAEAASVAGSAGLLGVGSAATGGGVGSATRDRR